MIVNTDRGAFNVLDSGTGVPVLLLHPLALSARVWDPFTDVTDGLRFLAVDARGHGDSDWDGAPFTMGDQAADVAAVIETLDVGPAAVVGMSMGGSTAVTLAGTHPELVSSLVLLAATACYGPDREQAWAQRAERAMSVPRAEQLPFQQDRWFTPATLQRKPESVQHVSDIFTATSSDAHAAACRAMGAMDSRPVLANITAPTLVIVGEEDYATPVDMARELHQGISGSRLEVVPAVRHLGVFDDDRVWQMVVGHVRATASATVR